MSTYPDIISDYKIAGDMVSSGYTGFTPTPGRAGASLPLAQGRSLQMLQADVAG